MTTYLNGGVFSLDSGNDSFTGSVLVDVVYGGIGNAALSCVSALAAPCRVSP